MPKTIVYHATTPDEVRQCAYSILKYLDVYNLKPPLDHSVVVHTNDPAALELYGSFFHSFQLKDIPAPTGSTESPGGPVLRLEPASYPLKPLEALFQTLERGGNGSAERSACIAHYGPGREINSLLQYFFRRHQEESVPNQVKMIHSIDALAIQQQRDAFQRLPFLTRLLRKATGKAWSIGKYMEKL